MSSVPAGLEITGTAQHAAWYGHTVPPVEEVRPGVWSIPVPVPDNPIRYTSSYVFVGSDGAAVLVDPGWDTDDSWTALLAGLSSAEVPPASIAGIVVTHVHPDHHGLSRRLVAISGAWVGMHRTEAEWLDRDRVNPDENTRADAEWLRALGIPDTIRDELVLTIEGRQIFATMATPTVALDDGQLLPIAGREVTAIWTPGHTPGHLSFHDRTDDLLLTGDHILPRISPNVGLQPLTAKPPLAPYLDSLRKLRPYETAEVLPAHEWRFRGIGARVDQLLDHHAERYDEILAVLADFGPATCWQLTERLTWSRGWDKVQGFQRRAAAAETLAHIEYLVDRGDLVADRTQLPWTVTRSAD